MKLLVIGNSPKFIKFIESIFPIAERLVINWRSIPLTSHAEGCIAKTHWDILLVTGYNYDTTMCGFESYMAKNVENIVDLVTACVEKNTCIVYINSLAPRRKYTWSRYLYAKMRLGKELAQIFPNLHALEFPSIIESNRISIVGGFFSKTTFRVLGIMGLVTNVVINKSADENLKLFRDLRVDPIVPKPLCLTISRPIFIDRVLRFILG